MNHNKNNKEKEKKDKTMDNLINVVENHTRTERHLEQYSNIGNPQYKEMARDKQKVREKQINELKNQIIGTNNDALTKQEQMENLKQNYQFGKGYIESNKEHMNQNDLQNLQRRQENRKIQMENLEENIKRNY